MAQSFCRVAAVDFLVEETLLKQVVVEEEVDVVVKRVVFELHPTDVAEVTRIFLHLIFIMPRWGDQPGTVEVVFALEHHMGCVSCPNFLFLRECAQSIVQVDGRDGFAVLASDQDAMLAHLNAVRG